MSIAASAALRAAVYDALLADSALTTLLGGAHVYDEPPRAATFPYVTLGEARMSDFSAGGEPGAEHQLTLHAWSRHGGHKEAHLIAGALLQAHRRCAAHAYRSSLGEFAFLGRRCAPRIRRPHLSCGRALPRDDRAVLN